MKKLALWQVLLILGTFAAFTVPLVLSQASAACVQPPTGMVSWWPGDGNADDIIGDNHGTMQNGATFGVGKVGQAFSFDGIDDYISVSDSSVLKPSGHFSVELWLKQNMDSVCDGMRNNFVPMGKITYDLKGYMIYEECRNNNWAFFVYGLSPKYVSFNSPNEVGVWKHFVGIYDGTHLITYVNGVLTNKVSVAGTVLHSSENLQFGKYSTTSNFFDGLIDEVAIYNRALTAEEIQAIYDAGVAGKCKPPTLSLTLISCCTYRIGDQFTVQAHVTNPGSRNVPVEAKIGVRLPDGMTVNVLGNKHLEVSLPAGLDTTFTLFDIPSLPDGLPTGSWTFEGTLLGPDLGETFSREVKPFEVVP